MEKKVIITQDLCTHVKALLGGGLTQKQAAKFVKVSPATVSRIRAASFDVNKYNRDTDERRIVEKNRKVDKAIEEIIKNANQNPLKVEKVEEKDGGIEVTASVPDEQVQGQISMNLQPAEEQKPEMSEQTKLMRFLAGKFNELDTTVQVTQAEILLRIGKIEDYLAQILRRMDK